jgi:hypothetical protein
MQFKEIRKPGTLATNIIIDDIVNPGHNIIDTNTYEGRVVLLEILPGLIVNQLTTLPSDLQPLGSFNNLWATAMLVATDTELLVCPPGPATETDPTATARQRFGLVSEKPLLVRIVNDSQTPLVEIMQYSAIPA